MSIQLALQGMQYPTEHQPNLLRDDRFDFRNELFCKVRCSWRCQVLHEKATLQSIGQSICGLDLSSPFAVSLSHAMIK